MRAIFLAFIFLLTTGTGSAQTVELSEVERLNEQVVALAAEGKLDEAIELAEKAVKLERKSRELPPAQFAVLTDNVARLKLRRIEKTESLLGSGELSTVERKRFEELVAADLKDVRRIFEDVLELLEKDVKQESLHSASVKRAYAGLLAVYGRDSDVSQAALLFEQATSTYSRIKGPTSELSLTTLFENVKFRFDRLDFEEAWPLVGRYVKTVEDGLGPDHEWLVPGLRLRMSLLLTAKREAEAASVADRVSKITRRPEPIADKLLNISGRSKNSRFKRGSWISLNDLRLLDAWGRDPRERIPSSTRPVLITIGAYEFVKVKVLVLENGNVAEASAETADPAKAKKAEDAVKDWKFKPLKFEGQATKMKGVVTYPLLLRYETAFLNHSARSGPSISV